MPKALRICNKQGCTEPTTASYCDAHKLPGWHNSKRNTKNPPGWQRIRQHILHRDANTCQYCGAAATEIDHIIPVSQGGNHTPGNLVASCTPCNKAKNLKERRQS